MSSRERVTESFDFFAAVVLLWVVAFCVAFWIGVVELVVWGWRSWR